MKPQQASKTSSASTIPQLPEQNSDLTIKQLDDKVNEGIKLYSRGEYKEAIKIFRMAAERGYARGWSNLIMVYREGKGVPKDEQEVKRLVSLIEAAALAGDAVAQNSLGILYFSGEGVIKDVIVAVKWLHLAAEQGYARAEYNLAFRYFNGEGVIKSNIEAVKWLHLAAEHGYADAQYYLAEIYFKGEYVTKDYAETKKWLHLAGEGGNVDAQCQLGSLYNEGLLGVPINYEESRKWYQLAANQGGVVAQFISGLIYERRHDDDKKTCEYFQLAADQNHPGAQYHLGRMYERGRGVQQDYVKACDWYQRAADQGDVEARYSLDDIHRLGLKISNASDNVSQPVSRSSSSIQIMDFKEDEKALETLVGQGWLYHYECNYEAAMAHFKVAANEGSPAGWNALANMYKGGKGIPENKKESSKFYALIIAAANDGNAEAQYNLGYMYKKGFGVELNHDKAVECFQRAADQGYAEAQYTLGNIYNAKLEYKKAFDLFQQASDQGCIEASDSLASMYMHGHGVPQDDDRCRALYRRSSDQIYRKKLYDKRILEYYKEAIEQYKKVAIDTRMFARLISDINDNMQRRDDGKGRCPIQRNDSFSNSSVVEYVFGRGDVLAGAISSTLLGDLFAFIQAPEVSLALRDYRRNRENGDVEDEPKECFPAAGLDTLFIRRADYKSKDLYPDHMGRYWWSLCTEPESLDSKNINRTINEDYYWIKDEKRGWPDKENEHCWWFIVFHAPTKTKIEGFSWRPDKEKGFPSKHGWYWYCVLYSECDDIKLWIERKEENYLSRKLSLKKNVLKIDVQQSVTIREESITEQNKIGPRFSNTISKNLFIKGNKFINKWDGDKSTLCDFLYLKNEFLLSRSVEGTIKCWDVNKKTGQAKYLGMWGGSSALVAVDKEWILSGGVDGDCSIIQCYKLDRDTGEISFFNIWNFSYYISSAVTAFAVLDDDLILSGSIDGTIRCWKLDKDTGEGKCLSLWLGHHNRITALIALNKKWVISGSNNGAIKCWALNNMGQIEFGYPLEGYDILLMSSLPENKKPHKGKIYFEKVDSRINYITLDQNETSVTDYLSFPIRNIEDLNSELSLEDLNLSIDRILNETSMRGYTTEYTGSVKAIVALGNSLIVSGTFNGTIKCWRIDAKTANAECLDMWQGPSNLLILSVLDNGWVLGGFKSGEIMCWEIDKETGKARYLDIWGGESQGGISALIALDNGWVLSGGDDGSIVCRLGIQPWLGYNRTVRRSLAYKKPTPAEPPRSYFLDEEIRKSTWDLELSPQPSSSLEEVGVSEKYENQPPISKRITVAVPQSDFKEEIDAFLASGSRGNNRKEWISLLTHIATHSLGLSIAGWQRLEVLYYSMFFEKGSFNEFWLIDIQNTFSIFLKNPELNFAFEQWVLQLLSSLHLRVKQLIQESHPFDQNGQIEKIWRNIRTFLKTELSPEIDGFLNKEAVQIAYIECFLFVLQFLKESDIRETLLCSAMALSLYRDLLQKREKATALYRLVDEILARKVYDWSKDQRTFINPEKIDLIPQGDIVIEEIITDTKQHLQEARIALQAKLEDGVLMRYEEILPLQEKSLISILENLKMLWQASIQKIGITPPCTYTLILLGSWARGDRTLYSDLEFLLLVGPHKDAEAQFAENMQNKWIASYFAQCFELFSVQILLLGEERSHYLENTTYCVGIHLDDLLLPFKYGDSFFGTAGNLAFKFQLGERSLNQEFDDHFRTISSGGGVTLQGTENGYPIIAAVSSYDAQFFYGDESLFKAYLHQRHTVLSERKGLGAYTSRTIVALSCSAVTLSLSMRNGKNLLQEIIVKRDFLSVVSGFIKVLSIYHGLRYEKDKDELAIMNTRERCRELVKCGLINKRLGHCLEIIYNFCNRFRSLSYSYYNRDNDSWLLFGKMLGAPSKFALTKHLWQVYPKIWKEVVVMLHDVMYPLNHAFSEWADLARAEFNPIRPFSVPPEALERYERTLENDGLNIAHRFNNVCSEILIARNVTHGATLKRFTKGWWEFLLVSLQHLSSKERQEFWIKLFSEFSCMEREQFIDEWDALMQDPVNFELQHGYFTEIEKEVLLTKIAIEFSAIEKNLFFDDAWTIPAYRKQKQWQNAVGGLFSSALRHHSDLEDVVIQKKSVVVGCLDPNINSRELRRKVQQGESISGLFVLRQEMHIALIDDEIRAFSEARENQAGKRHIVLFFENVIGGSIYHFCLKIFPENPGMEYTMTQLDYGLGGDELPDVWLWRIYTPFYPDGIAALLMEDLRGLKHTPKEKELMRNLSQVKIENPGALFAINTESFTRHFLRVLLSMPEDDKPNDYYIRPANLKSNLLPGFLLYRVDNERSLYVSELFEHSPSFLDGGGCNPEKADGVLKVKTVIYCMENMGKSLSGSVIERFVHLNMKRVFKRWLAQISIWNASASEIFKSKGIMPNISISSSSSSVPFSGEEPFMVARMHYNGNLYKHGVFHFAPNPLHVKEAENFCLTVMPVPMDKFMALYLLLKQVKQFFEEQKAKGQKPTGLEVLQAMRPDQYRYYHENLKPALRIGTKETNTKRLAKIVFDRFNEITKDGYNRDQESSSMYRTMVTSALGELMDAKDYEAVLQNRHLNVEDSAADTVTGLVSTLKKHELSHNWPNEIQMVEHILLERFYDILKAPIIDTGNPYSFFLFDDRPMVKRCNQILTEFTNLSLNNKIEFRRCFLGGKKKGDWNISVIHPEIKKYLLYLFLNEPMRPGEPVLRKLDTNAFKEMKVLDDKILLGLLKKHGKALEKAVIITTFNPYQISGFKKCLADCVKLKSLEFKIDFTKDQRSSRGLKSLECNLPELQKLTLTGFEGIESLTVKAPKLTQLTLRSLLNLTSIDVNMQKLQFIGLYHCPQMYSHIFQDMIIRRLELEQKMPVIKLENVRIKETFFMKVMAKRLQYEPDILSQITFISQFTVRQWLALDLAFSEECSTKEYKVYLSKALDQNANLKMLYSISNYQGSFAKALIGVVKSLSKVCPTLELIDIYVEGYHKDAFMAVLKLVCDEELTVNIHYNGTLLYESQSVKAEASSVSMPGMRK